MNISMNPNSELEQSIVSVPDIVAGTDDLISQARQFHSNDDVYLCDSGGKDEAGSIK